MDSMDLFKIWQEASDQKSTSLKSSKEEIMEAIKCKSNSTLEMIKSRMKIKLGWIVLFISLILIWFGLDHDNMEICYIQGFLLVMFALGFLSLYPVYKKMNNSIGAGKDTLTVMKTNANLIRKALKRETIWGLIFIPVAGVVGFTLGELYSGSTIAEIMMDSKGLLILLLISIVLIPLANIGAYKANQSAFGEYIRELDQNIVKMEHL